MFLYIINTTKAIEIPLFCNLISVSHEKVQTWAPRAAVKGSLGISLFTGYIWLVWGVGLVSLVNYFSWFVSWSCVTGSDQEKLNCFYSSHSNHGGCLSRCLWDMQMVDFGVMGGGLWFPAWIFREVEMGSLLWSYHQTKRGGLHFESPAHLSASWSHKNTWWTGSNY